MKRLLSFVLCVIIAVAAVCGAGTGDTGISMAVTASAASDANSMLPYYFNQLSASEQSAYLKIRSATIACKSRLRIRLTEEEINKIMNMMYISDVLVGFNLKNVEWIYDSWINVSEEIRFEYNFSKKDYNTIIKKADEHAAKVLAKFSSDTSDYAKIKYIHDYIISRADYRLDGRTVNNIYGALVKKEAKCDGYAHAFNYLCLKSGIESITVCGKEAGMGEGQYHAWNKVLYNKKWYNVDLTWDDPVGNIKDNKQYNYFMVSDKDMSATHTVSDLGYKVPEAKDSSKNYFSRKGLTAGSKAEAKKLFITQIANAADSGRNIVTIKVPDDRVYNEVCAAMNEDGSPFVANILKEANKRAECAVIGNIWQIGGDKGEMNLCSIMFFRKGASLTDYYKDPDQVDPGVVDFLISAGLEY